MIHFQLLPLYELLKPWQFSWINVILALFLPDCFARKKEEDTVTGKWFSYLLISLQNNSYNMYVKLWFSWMMSQLRYLNFKFKDWEQMRISWPDSVYLSFSTQDSQDNTLFCEYCQVGNCMQEKERGLCWLQSSLSICVGLVLGLALSTKTVDTTVLWSALHICRCRTHG